MPPNNSKKPQNSNKKAKSLLTITKALITGFMNGLFCYVFLKKIYGRNLKPEFYLRPKVYRTAWSIIPWSLKTPFFDALIPRMPGFKSGFKANQVTFFWMIVLFPLFYIIIAFNSAFLQLFTRKGLEFMETNSLLAIIYFVFSQFFTIYKLSIFYQMVRNFCNISFGKILSKIHNRPIEKLPALCYDMIASIIPAFLAPIIACPIDQYITGIGWNIVLKKSMGEVLFMIPLTLGGSVAKWVFEAIGI